MFKIKASYSAPRVDFIGFRKKLQETLGDAIARAALEWLGATTNAVPVWSGASMATFQPLASQIGLTLSISPVAHTDRIGLGLNNASGEIEADAAKGVFTFTYATTLRHLIHNEFNNANVSPDPGLFSALRNPGPYRFQEKGREAFDNVAKAVRLPEPEWRIKTIKV